MQNIYLVLQKQNFQNKFDKKIPKTVHLYK